MRQEWRCTDCRKLLGVLQEGESLFIRLSRGREYVVRPPAVAVCPRCSAINGLLTSRGSDLNITEFVRK